jgi:predicted nucleotidyltransferase
MAGLLETRRSESDSRLEQLKNRLAEAERIADGKACVYATGSFARGEASSHSDLDLFIVGATDSKDRKKRLLTRLDEICVKAELIRVTRELAIPEFSGDGAYLTHYTVADLVNTLGTSQDDSLNTFTARLLLLLESRPLFGDGVYRKAIDDTLLAYWRDYDDHKHEFVPAFLANDILRLWRTFCVNYEARTERDPPEKKAKRQLKRYKLKHSRLLTCYSALLHLMALLQEKQTVTPEDAATMAMQTPTARVESLMKNARLAVAHPTLSLLLAAYERFLQETDATEAVLVSKLMDPQQKRRMFREEDEFGELMFKALEQIGSGSPFYRMLVV